MPTEELNIVITCEYFKVETFKRRLSANGFLDFEVFPIKEMPGTAGIKLTVPSNKVEQVSRICHDVQTFYGNQMNNRHNN